MVLLIVIIAFFMKFIQYMWSYYILEGADNQGQKRLYLFSIPVHFNLLWLPPPSIHNDEEILFSKPCDLVSQRQHCFRGDGKGVPRVRAHGVVSKRFHFEVFQKFNEKQQLNENQHKTRLTTKTKTSCVSIL